ncbi:hypothetical protein [Microbacterium sp. SMR1]|uniref:hypothetical protein n=1 Tax=Microbacterium sp. SMR1 TaxID=1497340 RepID=UPI0011BEA4C1|nr:hypothetical protein [Microbacterium sp. SMR1]
MSTGLPERGGAAPTDPEYTNRHPIYGLPPRLLLDGDLFTYNAYLDAWTNAEGVEWTGWTILHGMSTTLRVEVAP